MKQSKALTALQALANEDRLALVRLLVPHGAEGLAAGEIARQMGLSASRLSFHLAQMEQAGLVTARKVARNIIYTIDAGGLGETIAFLLSDCCLEHPEVMACCRHGRAMTDTAPLRAAPDDAPRVPRES